MASCDIRKQPNKPNSATKYEKSPCNRLSNCTKIIYECRPTSFQIFATLNSQRIPTAKTVIPSTFQV